MSRGNNFSWKKVNSIFRKTNGTCFYCGVKLPSNTLYYDDNGNVVSESRNWDIEHMTPVSRGGGNEIENLVPSCISCNRTKHTKTAEEFINETN